MTWWTVVTGAVAPVIEKITNTVQWAWNSSLANWPKKGAQLATQIAFHILEQGVALRTAIPDLSANQQTQKIMRGSYHIMKEALPDFALFYVNENVQHYFRDGHEEDTWPHPYAFFLTGLTVVNFGVTAYIWQRGTQVFFKTEVLNLMAPLAHEKTQPSSACLVKKCDEQKKFEGWWSEPVLLTLKTSATSAAGSFIPYVGLPLSQALNIGLVGQYIIHMATPYACLQHYTKAQASVIALGLTNYAANSLLDNILESTVGLPPFLYYRTMQHVLLLLSINLAAHMTTPLVVADKNTLLPDLIKYYDQILRFLINSVFTGMITRIPIDFADEDAEPIFTLKSVAKKLALFFKSDLDLPISEQKKQAIRMILPPIFRGFHPFINDSVMKEFWPSLQKKALEITAFAITLVDNFYVTKAADLIPKATSYMVEQKYGIPQKTTRKIIDLSQKEAVVALLKEFDAWLRRHSGTKREILPSPAVPICEKTTSEKNNLSKCSNISLETPEKRSLLRRHSLLRSSCEPPYEPGCGHESGGPSSQR